MTLEPGQIVPNIGPKVPTKIPEPRRSDPVPRPLPQNEPVWLLEHLKPVTRRRGQTPFMSENQTQTPLKSAKSTLVSVCESGGSPRH